MTVFRLPDLGEGLSEAEIVTWHVTEGDHVTADQPLVSVETDKAVVEIPAPYSGTIARLIAREGEIAKIGAPLVEIETGRSEDTGAIVGELQGAGERTPKPPTKPSRSVKASPAVRRLAREMGVDLATLTGSGPGGAIQSRDVEAVAAGFQGEDLRGVRRAMAKAMAASHAVVVPATVTDRADISPWDDTDQPMPRLVRAIARASAIEPSLNAWFDGRRRQLHDHVDLAVAMDTPEGLFTPVLRDVGAAGDIEEQIEKLRHAVEIRTIGHADMKGATFTLSNFGMLGGEFTALVVTPPQVAILGAGRIVEACLAIDGRATVRRVLPLSLTFDHRAVTGGEAARFLAAIKCDLES
ncbi:MAG: dihydrolipoamide acetyltransferase family protein [Rhodobacter sp.]|nr:dihydrolipoamide acetyltransferase family protein [Rhodobacter sp.]